MAAGLLMAVAEASFRTQLGVDPAPAAVFESMNRILSRAGGPRSFFSAAYVLLSPDGSFEVVLAGHPPLARLSPAGAFVERFGRGSYPLGIRPGLGWEVERGVLAPGESLFFFSDGLVEARNRLGVELGEDAVIRLVRQVGTSPRALVDTLVRELDAFLGELPAEDDVSILVVRRQG